MIHDLSPVVTPPGCWGVQEEEAAKRKEEEERRAHEKHLLELQRQLEAKKSADTK